MYYLVHYLLLRFETAAIPQFKEKQFISEKFVLKIDYRNDHLSSQDNIQARLCCKGLTILNVTFMNFFLLVILRRNELLRSIRRNKLKKNFKTIVHRSKSHFTEPAKSRNIYGSGLRFSKQKFCYYFIMSLKCHTNMLKDKKIMKVD